MWKLILLQIIVALMPVFAFQVWYDYSKPRKNIPIILILICGACVLLGLEVCVEIKEFYLDYHYAPLLVGSLYGGIGVLIPLATIFIVAELYMMDGFWVWIDAVGMLLLLFPIIYKYHKGFLNFSRQRKLKIVMASTAVILLIRASAFIYYDWAEQPDLTSTDLFYFIGHELLYFLVMWMMLTFAENFIRRQMTAYELNGISNNYRIEVQKLQQFIDETPLGVIFVDQQGTITHINEMAIHLLRDKVGGKRRHELLGQPFTIMYDHIEKDVLGRLLYQALNGHRLTTEYVQEQGKMYVNSGICVRDMQNNEIIGAALIAHDITELSRLRDEIGRMERLSLVGQMAASITHEIRNPMAVIRGFVQLMRERSPEHQQEYFRIVMDELDRANSIINDFLSLAQNRIIEKESCSLHDILNEIMPLLWADANLRGQSIELRLAERIPALMLNEKEMKQLILNLARNGMEAMDQHGVLTIQTESHTDYVELRVNDNGSGIPKEKLERLFEPFFTTKSRGTGLGLPLCLSIIERHGGGIQVDSEEGIGTTFIVKIDRSRNHNEAAAALSAY
ncbi:nitrogen regulation protein NR(II) [Paenibacillus sp. BC26]|uniref:two-component system sensor histidine kinase NtrB n=1 Tax=Paenibacillus sp. BC26 TaxID=1881032 RepID=UPI0008EE32DF|nr:ATP-binding protein [Paenibacillus sp. BC26]SFT04153.1 PAS domain S-box-containing protein [Paenibacillus sp. BC26]